MQADKLSVIVRDILTEHELELESLDIVGGSRHAVVRVIVDGDGPEGRGPLLDDITRASQAISRALDDEPATGSRPYTLEITSRGVTRPLTEPKHWRRNIGRLVKVEREGAETVTGRIRETDDTSATLEVEIPPVKGAKGPKKTTTKNITIDLGEVRKAVIQVELTKMRAEDTTEELES
ncbi:ribosome maturation factor RimP [Enemella sp. A6]|uniref:ribosome maturation factor RimP n=1 Tax=Enemella sp. A6 TaxID=3440152 RepID=UPI003EB9088F